MKIEKDKEYLIKEEAHEKLLNALNNAHREFNQFKDLTLPEMLEAASEVILKCNYKDAVIKHQKEIIDKLKNQIK